MRLRRVGQVACRAVSRVALLTGLLLVLEGPRAEEPAKTDAPKPESTRSDPNVPQSQQEAPVESDTTDTKDRKIVQSWNNYDLRAFTLKWAIYSLLDWGTVYQDQTSADQIPVEETHDATVRDFRISINGKFNTARSFTYTTGIMYDGPTNSWMLRETGLQLAFPELWGNVFVGRQKEGFSLSKISVGYAPAMMERMPMNDATIPILADGIKWLGVHPSKHANWNIGIYRNVLEKNPATKQYETSFAARFAWLPITADEKDKNATLLHLGVGYHWGNFTDGQAQLRSRPGLFTAPYFLDTGVFAANINHEFGGELYFRKGSWWYGAEYEVDLVRSPQTGNPLFHGGEVFAAWTITGENRPYHDIGGKFGFLQPDESAFEGGPGAVELVLHASYSNFDSGVVQGGKLVRITPHVNWYLDPMVRLEFDYGLGLLDRFGVMGVTHFLQSRLMLMIQ